MRKRAGIRACGCGCGETTNLASRTYTQNGIRTLKGEPYRYIKNHHQRGKFRPSRPDLQPYDIPTSWTVAWAAGFWEGEGSAQKHRGTVQVSASQKEKWCLDILRRYFGGSIDKPNMNVCFYWRAHGELARGFLRAIYPYLSPRRQQQVERAGFDLEGGAK